MYVIRRNAFTYDHRLRRIGHPVRSAIHKPQIGRLVVGWVTTSEYLLLYVFVFFARYSSTSYLIIISILAIQPPLAMVLECGVRILISGWNRGSLA